MAGDGLVRPLNAPTAQPPAYGTQPGVNQAVVVASKVIITGANGELLAYNPSVGSNNLVGSIAGVQSTDGAPGNLVMAGVIGYTKVGPVYFAAQLGGSGSNEGIAFYTATSQAGPWTLRGFMLANATGMEIVSESALSLTTAGSAGAVIANLSSGLSGGLPVTQLNTTPASVGNSAAATAITNAWTIPAHDADNGAKYTIEAFVTVVTGATAAETLLLGLLLDGVTFVGLATLGAAFNGSATSTTYGIPIRLTIVPGAGSGGDAEIVLSGPLGDLTANRLATNSANMAGVSDTTVFNTTVSHTIALYAQWGGTGGTGQFAGTNWSEFTRSGQD